MEFKVNCKDLGKEDKELVMKGIKSYMELYDIDTQIHLVKEEQKSEKSDTLFFLEALELISKEVMSIREELRHHTAIGNPQHVEVI